MTDKQLAKKLQPLAPYFLTLALSFLVYQLYLVQGSFSALYNIALSATARNQATGSLWPLIWLSSEVSGEVGLILRFTGAILLVGLVWFFLRKKELSSPLLRKVVLLEAVYFLFFIPFVVYLLANPGHSITGVEAGISYALQIALIAPSLLIVYVKLKRNVQSLGKSQVLKWFAVAFCCYVFALWVKYFIFAIYSVGFNFAEPVTAIGSVNSAATLLIAAIASVAVFLPVIRGNKTSFSLKAVGGILICIGGYFIIFMLISLVNANYSKWVSLTEWWMTALPILGLGLLFRSSRKQS
jgi:hypothetical protein